MLVEQTNRGGTHFELAFEKLRPRTQHRVFCPSHILRMCALFLLRCRQDLQVRTLHLVPAVETCSALPRPQGTRRGPVGSGPALWSSPVSESLWEWAIFEIAHGGAPPHAWARWGFLLSERGVASERPTTGVKGPRGILCRRSFQWLPLPQSTWATRPSCLVQLPAPPETQVRGGEGSCLGHLAGVELH